MKFLDNDTFSTVIASTPLISIDLIVKNSQGKFLLGKRLNKPAYGSWFVPGGRIYKDETIEEAFKRITQDELGTVFCKKDAKFLGIYEHFYDDNVFNDHFSTHYIVMAFEIELQDDQVHCNSQHSSYKWFDREELLNDENVYKYTKDYFKRDEK